MRQSIRGEVDVTVWRTANFERKVKVCEAVVQFAKWRISRGVS